MAVDDVGPGEAALATFLLRFLMYSAVLAAFAVPVLIVALRHGKRSTARNFITWAVIIGAILALITVTSDQLVRSCQEAGNTQCVDYGSTGMFALFGGAYVVIAWARAWAMGR